MNGVNKVIIIGTLGKDPEVRYITNGDAVANLSVATNEVWKDKNSGEKKQTTEWHKVILWRRLAEIAKEYLQKGSQVYIEGKIQTRKWQDKDGNDRYSTEILAHELQMLGGRQHGTGQERRPQQHGNAAPQSAPEPDNFNDDIPF